MYTNGYFLCLLSNFMVKSPYEDSKKEEWLNITQTIIDEHPISTDALVDVTLTSWNDIFQSEIGANKIQIGKDIFPTPQIMGFFLHELIPLNIKAKFPHEWTKDKEVSEKDLVYIPEPKQSIEIKTSSHKKNIFGNRSYAQPSPNPKKDKSGFYLTVNFEKFSETKNPKIRLIRFGWLDHSDWIAQKAATGQQARLAPETYELKLIEIYPEPKLSLL